MTVRRYKDYKSSGLAWLGPIPEHWEVIPCRGLVVEKTAKNEGALCNDYLSLVANVGVMPYAEKGDVGNKKPDDLSKCKIVSRGDFVINSMNYGIGAYGLSNYDGVCSPVYIVLGPRKDIVEPRFAFRIFENRAFQTFAQSFGNGILEHRCAINWDILKSIGIGVPPKVEQVAIVAFLDSETLKIDALISEQERLIELLKEKRQSAIAYAVTKGLNKNTPIKDSGVEWLGKIPKHWSVKRIKYLVPKIEQGWSPQCEGFPVETESEWGVLKVGCVNGGKFDPAENKALPPDLEPIPSLGIAANDLLISRANSRELVGSAAVAESAHPNLMLCDKLYRLRVDESLCLPHFLSLYLGIDAVRGRIELDATGASSSMLNIGQATILGLDLPLPPIEEQLEITSFITSQIKKIDGLMAEADAAMSLLQERRSALISAAVTGEIDVRGRAADRSGQGVAA